LLRLACPATRLPQLALVCGLAARDAIARAASGVDVKIKWPNDVVIVIDRGGVMKKIAGVLVEASFKGGAAESLVCGIGVNVHTRSFPEEIATRATSLAALGAPAPSRAEILVDILAALDRDAARVAAHGLRAVHARLAAVDALRGARVTRDDGAAGVAEGIDEEGRLVIRSDDGSLARWSAGEVHLI
jgi:BirA family biotin operon repressor/biotin-[acetyl-CoA-carboxylase] ligase